MRNAWVNPGVSTIKQLLASKTHTVIWFNAKTGTRASRPLRALLGAKAQRQLSSRGNANGSIRKDISQHRRTGTRDSPTSRGVGAEPAGCRGRDGRFSVDVIANRKRHRKTGRGQHRATDVVG